MLSSDPPSLCKPALSTVASSSATRNHPCLIIPFFQNNVVISATSADNVLLVLTNVVTTVLNIRLTFIAESLERVSEKPCLRKISCHFCQEPSMCQVN